MYSSCIPPIVYLVVQAFNCVLKENHKGRFINDVNIRRSQIVSFSHQNYSFTTTCDKIILGENFNIIFSVALEISRIFFWENMQTVPVWTVHTFLFQMESFFKKSWNRSWINIFKCIFRFTLMRLSKFLDVICEWL